MGFHDSSQSQGKKRKLAIFVDCLCVGTFLLLSQDIYSCALAFTPCCVECEDQPEVKKKPSQAFTKNACIGGNGFDLLDSPVYTRAF